MSKIGSWAYCPDEERLGITFCDYCLTHLGRTGNCVADVDHSNNSSQNLVDIVAIDKVTQHGLILIGPVMLTENPPAAVYWNYGS